MFLNMKRHEPEIDFFKELPINWSGSLEKSQTNLARTKHQ